MKGGVHLCSVKHLLMTLLTLCCQPIAASRILQATTDSVGAYAGAKKETQPLSLTDVLTRTPEDAYFGSRAFQCSAINAAVEVVSRAADLYADLAALPEALYPAQRAVAHLSQSTMLPEASLSHSTGEPACYGAVTWDLHVILPSS